MNNMNNDMKANADKFPLIFHSESDTIVTVGDF